eukprot:Sspe_Gene.107827::Locus_86441_Transcript_1_1_Confidence_1.000_Length_1343::g.107827::m.107827
MEGKGWPVSTVFMCEHREGDGVHAIRCAFNGCDAETHEWVLMDEDGVRSVERHVGDAVYRDMERRLPPPPPSEVDIPDGAQRVVVVLELQCGNSTTAPFLSQVVPRGVWGYVAHTFHSRRQLFERIESLSGITAPCWVLLVTHASTQGQVFSCTPQAMVTASPPSSPSRGEEFCSVHDFVTMVQGTVRNLAGIHVSACCAAKFLKTVHTSWPVPSDWLAASPPVTGYTEDLFVTDGVFLLVLLSFNLSPSIIAPGVARDAGLCSFAPTPNSRRAKRAHEKRAAQQKLPDAVNVHIVPCTCCEQLRTAMSAIPALTNPRNDLRGVCTVEGVSRPTGGLLVLGEGCCVPEGYDWCGALVIGSSRKRPRDDIAFPVRHIQHKCHTDYPLLVAGLTYMVLLAVGEGWSLDDIVDEVASKAPGVSRAMGITP